MTNTINVPSIDEFTNKIIEKGGQLIIPKRVISKIEWFRQCIDTEGDAFGIIEMNERAM
jgi:predicted enzyme related to lactoylglutathione lyase